ncbi:hypothetical protein, partial [Mycobacterium tuberculosis]|uniref:hypothetical protein n=1 Tax=Mycobacterium tuberculosis TaxID=1773 RepID=UPI000B23302C
MRFTVAARLQVRRRERGSRPPGYGNPFIPFLPNSPPVSSGAAVTAVADQPGFAAEPTGAPGTAE